MLAAPGLAALMLGAAPACARDAQRVDIAAQPLSAALIELGRQTRHSIGGVDVQLSAVRSRPVHGRYGVEQALRIMLAGSGFAFRIVDARTIEIVRRALPAPAPAAPRPARPSPARPPAAPPPAADIIVTATKRQVALRYFPGSLHIERTGEGSLLARQGSGGLVNRLPVLASTDLGTGRNKLFVRGVADSSFSGPTQSTVGLYFGEMRVTYNAPDPDLRLYDTDHVEVIEGPQGTLYGAGTLGGIIKIVPRPAEVDAVHAAVGIGRSWTRGGAPGFDGNAMANLPIVRDVAALRLVGYFQREGGYINNSTTGGRNTNGTDVFGGRASLRLRPGDGWTVDLNGLAQDILAADAQYAQHNLPPRTHAANFAQTHDNDIRGVNIVAARQWHGLALVSNSALVDHRLDTRLDATGYLVNAGVAALDEAERISLLSHETRLSGTIGTRGSWVGGVGLVRSVDRIETALAPLGAMPARSLLRNQKLEAAGFGEATVPIGAGWAATVGGRLVYATTASQLTRVALPDIEPVRRELRFLPTAALSWVPRDAMIAYLRVQSGFRGGGLAEAGPLLDEAVVFAADQIDTLELGMRFGPERRLARGEVSGAAAISVADWRDVQADIISLDGLPFTSNLGRGRILGIEANLAWMPFAGLLVEAAGFANANRLVPYANAAAGAATLRLPNIADLGGRLGFSWTRPLAGRLTFQLDGNIRYVGASEPGTQGLILPPQGDYADANLSAALQRGPWRWSLDVRNLLDTRANTFSYGNPFTVAQGNQITPLRPQTIRLGMALRF